MATLLTTHILSFIDKAISLLALSFSCIFADPSATEELSTAPQMLLKHRHGLQGMLRLGCRLIVLFANPQRQKALLYSAEDYHHISRGGRFQ
jgi:hypothetical protein